MVRSETRRERLWDEGSLQLDSRDGQDEAPAATMIGLFLTHHFILEIPDEDEEVVGLTLGNDLRTDHRDAAAGHAPPLLVRTAVSDKRDGVGGDAAIVQENAAFCRRSVGADGLARRAQLAQRRVEIVAHALDGLAKVAVIGLARQPECL